MPHIALVFREMWDTTALSLLVSSQLMHLAVNIGGIPHLAKDERDVGHPAFVAELVLFPFLFHWEDFTGCPSEPAVRALRTNRFSQPI